ncbi:F-ATPase subunit 6 [Salinivirga cyanobacteriivorans]|uniref:ATP synthase subunit a n=1 Tax=Salinivirga cyanobacteriivorans TaxID=1307839 RepID=A0A0S2I058_9BACT|nr:F0F1 ATP synthase subunit A [Salinivirga cyanobacteriivorans]ALO15655.1 F-ATPase subunit 6 [Salinivirga cyanobacteriivorans]
MRAFLISLFTVFFVFASIAADDKHKVSEEKELDVKEVIVGHIVNDYSWHILTTPEGQHVSIPLPVILYSKRSGFHVFMSSKFHHGHASYKNFKIAEKGANAGKIVEFDEQGNIYESGLIDLSITKVIVGVFVTVIFLLIVFLRAAKIAQKNPNSAPRGLLSFVEPLIVFIRDEIAEATIGKKKDQFLPYLLTIFFFIFFTNLFGLIPIPPFGANVTGNISVTASLALMTFSVTTIKGNRNYWNHIFNTPGVPWWLKVPIPLMPFVELIGVFTKPIVLAIRLFANITAGHIVLLAFITLIFIFGSIAPAIGFIVSPVSMLFAVFMMMLEILVAFIQAFVFTLLSAIYFGMAVEEHHS